MMPPESARPLTATEEMRALVARLQRTHDASQRAAMAAGIRALAPVVRAEQDAAWGRLLEENATLRAACQQACVAMSRRYGCDPGTLGDGSEEVLQRYGGGMAYAYEMLRQALTVTDPAAPGAPS